MQFKHVSVLHGGVSLLILSGSGEQRVLQAYMGWPTRCYSRLGAGTIHDGVHLHFQPHVYQVFDSGFLLENL